jgi:hypothetical protein
MASQAEQVRAGGWIIAHYKAVNFYDVDDTVFDDYEAIIVAAKSAEFLSTIRALGRIDNKKYEVYRKLARLKPKQAAGMLAELEKLGALAVEREATDPADIVAVTSNLTTKAASRGNYLRSVTTVLQ